MRTHAPRHPYLTAWLLTALLPLAAGLAAPRTWTGTGDATNWFDAANWDTGLPATGDDVTVGGGASVLLTNTTAALNSFTITNATLTFTNWNSTLQATDVFIQNDGTLAHAICATNLAAGNTNRVHIVCSNLTVEVGGAIDVEARGYPGGGPTQSGYGPGGGITVATHSGGGGGHGGTGGRANTGAAYGGATYGSASAPDFPGSGGGGGQWGQGGHGGGAIRVEATGAVTVDGSISADGGDGTYTDLDYYQNHAGGGSGGGIYITCLTIAGSGAIRADGGGYYREGGGSGGGRIAIHYNTAAQQAKSPTLTLSSDFFPHYNTGEDSGTLYLPDSQLLPENLVTRFPNKIYVYGVEAWAPNKVTAANTIVRFKTPGFDLDVTNDVAASGASGGLGWDLSNAVCHIGGDLVITNGASVVFEMAGTTNDAGPWTNCAGIVTVTGDLQIAAASTLYVYSHPTNGGALRIDINGNVNVAATGVIDGDAKGFEGKAEVFGYGPGSGHGYSNSGGGAGYGGVGGWGNHGIPYSYGAWPGPTYGSIDRPILPGSAGGGLPPTRNYIGGSGGAAIWIETPGTVTIDGTVTANGGQRIQGNGGSGSGGAILIDCGTFAGSGLVRADGGEQAGEGGSGGGGRIAVHYTSATPGTTVKFSSHRQAWTQTTRYKSDPGTIWLSDSSFFPGDMITYDGIVYYDGASPSWSGGKLDVATATWFGFGDEIQITVASNIIVRTDYSRLDLHQAQVSCDGISVQDATTLNVLRGDHSSESLTVAGNVTVDTGTFNYYFPLTNPASLSIGGSISITNAGDLYLHSGLTNSATAAYGGLLDWGLRDLTIPNTGTLHTTSHPTNGGSVKLSLRNLTIESGGSLDASGGGFAGRYEAAGYGPGAGSKVTSSGGGGAYGGSGGNTPHGAVGGSPYGDATNAPLHAGSAGGGRSGQTGGAGGGGVWIDVADTLTLNGGSILADGEAGTSAYAGAGAGGSIHVRCYRLSGTSGTLAADGANSGGEGGGGGGGRIAILRDFHDIAATNVTVAGGTGWASGTTGSIFWGTANLPVPALPPVVSNRVAGPVTLASADLNGILAATNQSLTGAFVLWGDEDAGAGWAGWDTTNHFTGTQTPGLLTETVTLPAADKVYYYRFGATNGAGDDFAAPVESLVAGDVIIEASDPNAQEAVTPDTGTFTIRRPDWSTNVAITVNYAISGSASNGADYETVASTIDMPVGASNVTITITPTLDGFVEGGETVVLSLLSGAYAIGTPASNTVTIADVVVAASNTWTGSGNWSSAGNWSESYVPVVNQHVIVDGDVTLTNTTERYASYTLVSNRTHTFSGRDACLNADEVQINGTVTHVDNTATTTNALGGWDWNGRVYIVCSNLTLASYAEIALAGKGYQGGVNHSGYGPGQGLATSLSGGGGGYGGAGSRGNPGHAGNYGGSTYSSASAPDQPGSGGGGRTSGGIGGDGGGLVVIDANGVVTIDGTIDANATAATAGNSGGGSGGGVSIACLWIQGSGHVRADGGAYLSEGGTGGGGRIAIDYDPAAQLANAPHPDLTLSVKPLLRYLWSEAGTVYFPDETALEETVTDRFASEVYVHGPTSWSPTDLLVSNVIFRLVEPGFQMSVANDLLVTGASGGFHIDIANRELTIGHDLRLASGADMHVYSGPTNAVGVWTNQGALVTISNALTIADAGSTLYPHSEAFNGGSVKIVAVDAALTGGGTINGNALGFSQGTSTHTSGYGPGGGKRGANSGGGGGYGGAGGKGGHTTSYGGVTYGSMETPKEPGSGGGDYRAYANNGNGGGLVWLEASDSVTLDGTITAQGGTPSGYQGAGSGGGIYIFTTRFNGTSNGWLRAIGGNSGSESGGGGGGRIAVWSWKQNWAYTNQVSVAGGTAYAVAGEDGTVYWGEWAPPQGTIMIIR